METKKVNYYLTMVKEINVEKNCNINEAEEYLNKPPFVGWYYTDCNVCKEVCMSQNEYENYTKDLMQRVDFLGTDTGGSMTDDPRIETYNDYSKMTKKERTTVKWITRVVAILVNKEIKLLINSEGYDYARIILFTSKKTEKKESLGEYQPQKLFEPKTSKSNLYSLFENKQLNKINEPLPRGMVLIATYGGCRTKYYVTTGRPNEAILLSYYVPKDISENIDSNKEYYENTIRPLWEEYGIGIYYTNDIVDEEVVVKCEETAQKIEEHRIKHQEWYEKEYEKTKKQIEEEYSYLTKQEKETWNDAKTTSANIKAVLKKHFPNTNFKINQKNYKIKWIDGPTEKQVSEIASKFETHRQDYEDKPEINKSDIITRLYGHMTYILYEREISNKTTSELDKILHEECPAISKMEQTFNTNKIPEDELKIKAEEQINKLIDKYAHKYINHNIYIRKTKEELNAYETDIIKLIFKFLDLSTKKNTSKQKKETKSQVLNGCQIVDYSEKAIAIIGDTKAHINKLKELGARFNPKLTCGPAWILPKSKQDLISVA